MVENTSDECTCPQCGKNVVVFKATVTKNALGQLHINLPKTMSELFEVSDRWVKKPYLIRMVRTEE